MSLFCGLAFLGMACIMGVTGRPINSSGRAYYKTLSYGIINHALVICVQHEGLN